MKNAVEILFQESLVKAPTSTEALAKGLRMLVRAVISRICAKSSGETPTHVSSSEFVQMRSREGRRGKDDLGNTILNCEEMRSRSYHQTRLAERWSCSIRPHDSARISCSTCCQRRRKT